MLFETILHMVKFPLHVLTNFNFVDEKKNTTLDVLHKARLLFYKLAVPFFFFFADLWEKMPLTHFKNKIMKFGKELRLLRNMEHEIFEKFINHLKSSSELKRNVIEKLESKGHYENAKSGPFEE